MLTADKVQDNNSALLSLVAPRSQLGHPLLALLGGTTTQGRPPPCTQGRAGVSLLELGMGCGRVRGTCWPRWTGKGGRGRMVCLGFLLAEVKRPGPQG